MSAEEERGLMRLLMHLWKSLQKYGTGIPDDDVTLARWALVSLRKWRRGLGARLRRLFFAKDGYLYNERLMAEWENFKAKSAGRSDKARGAAEARWGRRPKTGAMESAASIVSRMPAAFARHARSMHAQCSEHPTSEQTTEIQKSEASVNSDSCTASLCLEETAESMPNEETMRLNGDDVKQAAEMLRTVAKRTSIDAHKSPDWKITAQILVAAGGTAALIGHLAELEQRDLRHVDSFGYFLRAIEARRGSQRAKAG
jgi:uncharacterized protein YdaU (DUF1376 family)